MACCEVAQKTNTSVSDCQMKRKNIWNGFVRSLKPTPSGSCTKQNKLYFLHDELQFIVGYIEAFIYNSEPDNVVTDSSLGTEGSKHSLIDEIQAHSSEMLCSKPVSNNYKKTEIIKLVEERVEH
ncbi:hypothetical protein O3G_MSEX012189 [Manduca sexta]|uniref:Uncharacterized protein n=1 Tax=Manduca sexta TaxID=7130 RepID=A0A921ZNZ6_MANSE|nr:hypothetical protein O3G_MSEX012189 [Manduca sexta]